LDHPPDYWGPRERAEEAKTLLGSAIYGMAIVALRRSYMDELIGLAPGDPKVTVLHVKLKLLDDVTGQLQHYVNEFQFKQQRERAA